MQKLPVGALKEPCGQAFTHEPLIVLKGYPGQDSHYEPVKNKYWKEKYFTRL